MEIDELRRLEEAILRDYGAVECMVYPEDKYLRVSKPSKCGVKYLPNFNLIINAVINGSFCLRLTTYHGRTLDTVMFKLEEGIVPERVARRLQDIVETMRICEGVSGSCSGDFRNNDCLLECFNDSTIMRSLRCKFVLDHDSLTSECDECRKLLSIKMELTRDSKDCSEMLRTAKSAIDGLECNPSLMVMSSLKEEEEEEEEEEDLSAFYDDTYLEEEVDWPPPTKRGRGRPRKYKSEGEAEHFANGEPVKRGRGRPRREDAYSLNTPLKKTKTKLLANLSGEKPYFKFNRDALSIDSAPIPDDRIQCRICLRTYKSESAVAIHFNSHAKFFDVEGTMACPLCQEAVKKLDLTEHFDTAHSTKEHSTTCCLACLEVMSHKKGDSLREHIIKFHHQKHMCEICGKVFNYSKFLDCHVKTIHTDVKNYFCDRCGKGFGHQIALQKHVQVACATEEWKCAVCAKIFGCRKKIRFHLMVHCEEKPYACKHCTYRSYKADNLSLHVKKTHHLKGVRADFITIPEILKAQSEYVDKYLEKARLK